MMFPLTTADLSKQDEQKWFQHGPPGRGQTKQGGPSGGFRPSSQRGHLGPYTQNLGPGP